MLKINRPNSTTQPWCPHRQPGPGLLHSQCPRLYISLPRQPTCHIGKQTCEACYRAAQPIILPRTTKPIGPPASSTRTPAGRPILQIPCLLRFGLLTATFRRYNHRNLHRNVFVQTDRNCVIPGLLDRVTHIYLAPVDLETLFLKSLDDIH
jgi:hypothetical protein